MSDRRILYVAGSRHCGSTILDLVLGGHPDLASLGQVSDVYRFWDGTETCTCHQPLDACTLWGPAVRALGPDDQASLRRLGPTVLKERRLATFLASTSAREAYMGPVDRLYDELFERTGARVLVDSSKNVTRAVAHLRSSRYPTTVVHLARDSRGMVNTFSRNAGRRVVARPMAQWLVKNATASAVLRPLAGRDYLFERYEDLLLHPDEVLGRIGAAIDVDLSPQVELVRHGGPLGERHIFRGNPRLRASTTLAVDPHRLESQGFDPAAQARFWRRGGFVTALWGYDREQRYVAEAKARPPAEGA